MNIAIAVHGRFEAFDLARELLRRGHQVSLLTNYPRWAVERFGVPGGNVRSFWPHGVLTRAAGRLSRAAGRRLCERQLHELFGQWVSRTLQRDRWDVVYAFSGVAEERLRARGRDSGLHIVVRASAHIRSQDRLLREEELRTGIPQDRPSPWMIAREEREYALADLIRVLSSFSYQTFVDEGVDASKLRLIVSGVQTQAFRPTEEDLEERCRRLLSGAPVRVLNVGTFAFRKGIWDSAAAIRTLGTERFTFRFVGPIAAEAIRLKTELEPYATFVPKQAQSMLPAAYAWGDVFMLPTVEDGYPAVLAQAAAAGLPIVTTPNGAGWDLVADGKSGWVVPIRRPDRLVDTLRWIDTHRVEAAAMVRGTQTSLRLRDSADVAADFERLCDRAVVAQRERA